MTYPLSQSQLSIYLACQGLEPEGGNYQQASLYKLPGNIDIERLAAAAEAVIRAHPYALSRIVLEEGMPRVEDHTGEAWKPLLRTVDSIDEVRPGFCRTMDLLKDPLFRLEIYQTKEGSYFYIDFHHIIFDGASAQLMIDHLSRAYAGEDLPAEPIDGFQIALREEEQRNSEAYAEATQWYAETFGEGAQLDSRILPDVYGLPAQPYRELVMDLPVKGEAVKSLIAKYRCADSVLLTAAFGATLAAWTANTRSCFSTIWNGRRGPSLNALTMCVHTMPVFVDADPSLSVAELLDKMKQQVSGSRARAFYSFADCARDLGMNAGISFGYQGQFVTETLPIRIDGEEIPAEDLRTNPPGIGLSIELFSRPDGSQVIRFWYKPEQYSEKILRQFAESFAAVLASMEKAGTLADLKYVTPRQRKQLDKFLPDFTGVDLRKTVLDFFRENVQKAPEATALVSHETRLSYAELDRLSDHLAVEIEKHVKPGGVVSIILGRNEFMAIAPLAAIKAGCTYQPLDPSYPQERLHFMVGDAHAGMLIADPGMESLIGDYDGPVLTTDRIAGLPAGKPKGSPKPEDLIILLYTSGTTGTPKGCMLTHSNVNTFCQVSNAQLGLGPKSVMTAYASFGFDAFMGDLWRVLVAGASIHIIPEEIRLDLVALNAYFEANGITHAFMTTQVATQFALNFPRCKGLKILTTGGEKMASIAPPAYKLYNCYGPTECSCYVVDKLVEKKEENIPIGRPFPGVHTFIATKNGQLLPVGAAGELLLAGPQVGMGYLGLPEKTAEVFTENPFEKDPLYGRTYHTGDIVRWREDSDIEFVGRKDSQVKVRGFRIELKEVETVIHDFPGINDVTVQAFDDKTPGGGKFLAAYVVADKPIDIKALNAYILDKKPPYMVPAVTMQIERIPLTVNQKVDRKALPEPIPQQSQQKVGEAAPFNILEQEIADLISETVHIDGISLTEPLIYYGLTSLSALRLATEIYKKYGVQMNMDSFVRTASLQSIENEVLKALIAGQGPQESRSLHRADSPQPLTFQQSGVYFDCMKAPQETIYNIPMMWTLPASLSSETVCKAVEELIRCHPALNAHFETRDGQVVQVPSDAAPHVECETVEPEQFEAYKTHFKQPFNLSEGPLYHVAVVRSGDGLYLFTDFHHLVFDGRSYDIFITQLTEALSGKEPVPENYTYFDYAQDQLEARESEAFAAARDFFAGQMAGCEGASGILPDLEAEGPGREALLTKRVGADIAQRCLDLGISHASYYLAAAYLAVGAFCGSRKVYMCTISNGRSDMRTADTLGMFVNTLALASDIGHGSVDDYLKETDRLFSTTLQHESYPFAQVAADYGFQPQIMLAYQVGVLTRYEVDGREVESENLEIGTPKFPLSIFIDGKEGEEYIALEYDKTRFSEGLMQSFADAMETLMRGMLSDGPLDALALVDGDRVKTLDGFNNHTLKVDTKQTIVSLFRAQAAARPEAPAVSYEDITLTYGELDRLTDRLASAIAARGLGHEDVVSILIGRSQMMAVTALGALKAGCAYQPLDPSYPQERLNFMVQDASARLLIAEKDLRPLVKDYKGPVILTDEIAGLGEGPVPEGPAPESLFILLYTSGSTGVPKGCMLEHRNLVNFCAWYRNYYDLTPDCRVAAYASFGFDACMMDLYPALTSGASVYIIPEETRHDMSELSAFITDNRITHSFMTTQVGVMFARNFPGNPALKHLSVGGEKLVSIDPPSYAFHNGYGPTECTIFSTIFDVRKKEANIPIGHPLDNLRLYVVDDCGRRLPVGAAGELWISGPQVSRGYLNRPEKTQETFIANPFDQKAPYDRVYRTGDIVRYRPDGNIEFVGRNDGQVKIRGFRVETKEVEAVIREFPGVKDVTVQAFDAPSGGKFIAAYIVMDGTLDTKALSAFILERKPPYMVPAALMQIDSIPLNVNQKVDRKALPAPVSSTDENYVEPENDTERTLCEVFAQVLDLKRVGALDNFFDLGGSSLMVTNVLVEAEKRGLKFSYGEVFIYPTARALAAHLSGNETEATGAPLSDSELKKYDYTAIDELLSHNTLEALAGKPQPLGKNILLTGATGFLGVHVLRELLEQTGRGTTIWCQLRGKGELTAERRLAEMLVYYFEKKYRLQIGKRIRVVEGDITHPEDFEALAASETKFDLVINCAANVKHFSKGDDIERINYGGVKNLVDFCEKTGARLIQVSTESVAGMAEIDTPHFLTEQELWFGQLTDNQYIQSKFLAERLVLEHMAAGTLDAKIMRAGNLSPRASDGEFQMNLNANTTMGRIKAYRMLGVCPYALLQSRMEFSPIDETARAIVLLSGTPRANCVFNVSNDHLIPMDDILARIRLDDGSRIAYVEYDAFLQRMEEAKADPQKAQVLSSILAYMTTPGGAKMITNPASNDFTMQVLHRLGFRWNETSSSYVDMVFDMLASLRYFEV